VDGGAAAAAGAGWLRGRGGQPKAYCHRAILDAIRYLVDNGTKWRAIPADFPRRRAVSSRSSSSPTTDGIPDLHQSDDTTRHDTSRHVTLPETADPMPDQQKHSPQARKDNSHSA
jgi:transposase